MDIAVTAGEIIVSWQRKGTKGSIWKVDFVKAYNSLDWDFLWSSMRRRGFPKELMTWVKEMY